MWKNKYLVGEGRGRPRKGRPTCTTSSYSFLADGSNNLPQINESRRGEEKIDSLQRTAGRRTHAYDVNKRREPAAKYYGRFDSVALSANQCSAVQIMSLLNAIIQLFIHSSLPVNPPIHLPHAAAPQDDRRVSSAPQEAQKRLLHTLITAKSS